MSVTIPDDIVHAARLTDDELRREIAVLLFQQERLTLAGASKLAGLGLIEFQQLLASRQIPVHYDVQDLEDDIRTLEQLRRP